MGPGYFPLVLSVLLLGLGGLILASAIHDRGGEGMGKLAWRGMFFILPAPVFFGLTVRGLGFVPSIFLTTLIAALASLKMQLPCGLACWPSPSRSLRRWSSAMRLGLPFRRFGPWLAVLKGAA